MLEAYGRDVDSAVGVDEESVKVEHLGTPVFSKMDGPLIWLGMGGWVCSFTISRKLFKKAPSSVVNLTNPNLPFRCLDLVTYSHICLYFGQFFS